MDKKEALKREREELKQYGEMIKRREELVERKHEIIISMENAKSSRINGVPRGSGASTKGLAEDMAKLDDCYLDIDSLEKQLDKKREEYVNKFRGLKEYEAAVMRKRYIEIKDWKTITEEMNKSRAQVNRYHDAALKKIAGIKM